MRPIITWLTVALLCFIVTSGAHAKDEQKQQLSQQTYESIMAAQKALDTGNTKKAITDLQRLAEELAEKPYEQAVVLQSLAHAHIARDNYAAAIPPLKHCIDLAALPEEPQQRARYNLATLYMATEKFGKAIDLLGTWFTQAREPKPEAYVMLATAHLQRKQYREAIKPLRTAIDMTTAPKESWYQSLLGAHSELKEYNRCAELLHLMLKLFPERTSYWRQLVGIQLTREKYQDALAVMELALLRGQLETEQEYLNLAQLYMHLNAPFKAAKLIEVQMKKGLLKASSKNWEYAANAWLLAREIEKAINALEQAIKGTGNSDLTLRLAQLYIEHEQWTKAADQLRRLLKDKKLQGNKAGRAWLLLGIAEIKSQESQRAFTAFTQAAKHPKTREPATQWLSYLNNQ